MNITAQESTGKYRIAQDEYYSTGKYRIAQDEYYSTGPNKPRCKIVEGIEPR